MLNISQTNISQIHFNCYFCKTDHEFRLAMTQDDIEKIFAGYPENKKEGLLPILQEMQLQNGYLTDELLAAVGKYLNLPSNKVYGVATFYDQFRFHPDGRHHIRLCRGTACHLAGSSTYLEELEKHLKLKAGQTSKDKRFSLEISNCLGACESSPIIQINDIFHTNVSPEDLNKIIVSLKEKTE
jgi:NADH-quinone oxidoreductase subunit E